MSNGEVSNLVGGFAYRRSRNHDGTLMVTWAYHYLWNAEIRPGTCINMASESSPLSWLLTRTCSFRFVPSNDKRSAEDPPRFQKEILEVTPLSFVVLPLVIGLVRARTPCS